VMYVILIFVFLNSKLYNSLYIVTSSCILISRHDQILKFYQHLLIVQSPYQQLLKLLCFSL
jgi:hypothetical protein